jgi:hypothetical protein
VRKITVHILVCANTAIGVCPELTGPLNVVEKKFLYKAEPHGTENIFHVGQISALYKINNTDSSGRDYRICSH